MKLYKMVMFSVFLLAISVISLVSANDNIILQDKTIYIDPGHGGVDPGAVYKDVYEENINLEISLKLKEVLEKNGAIVLMTRDGDYDLSSKNASLRKRSDLYNRSKLINDSNADLYLSIHLNAEPTGVWSGAQTFYDDVNSNNIVLAEFIQKELKNDLKTKRTYKKINDGYLYQRVKTPGVLIEVGFLSNSVERQYLQKDEYQYKIATSITKGIKKYFYSI